MSDEELGIHWMHNERFSVGSTWMLRVTAFLDAVGAIRGNLTATLMKGSTLMATHSQKVALDTEGLSSISFNLTVAGVVPWFPRGFGSQPLYDLRVEWQPADRYLETDSSIVTRRVGFRTAELVQDRIPGGRSFYFRINGVPIFAKGANFIPADTFHSRVTRDVLENLFDSFEATNFNMLRNWGGGIYQKDYFYELADERGILVWEEFMAAVRHHSPREVFRVPWCCRVAPRDSPFG